MRLKDKERTKEKKYKVSWKAGIWLEQLIPSPLPNSEQDVGATLPDPFAVATATARVLLSRKAEEIDTHQCCPTVLNWVGLFSSWERDPLYQTFSTASEGSGSAFQVL